MFNRVAKKVHAQYCIIRIILHRALSIRFITGMDMHLQTTKTFNKSAAF